MPLLFFIYQKAAEKELRDNAEQPSFDLATKTTTGTTELECPSVSKAALSSMADRWASLVNTTRYPILLFLHPLTQCSARNPWITVVTVIALAFGVFVVGFTTSFHLEVRDAVLWTPQGSKPSQHRVWIEEKSNFPKPPRVALLFFHEDGANLVNNVQENLRRVFEAVDTVQKQQTFRDICEFGERKELCQLLGVADFWYDNSTLFEQDMKAQSAQDTIAAISSKYFPDGTPFYDDKVFGKLQRSNDSLLESFQSLSVKFEFPPTDEVKEFESDIIDSILALQDQWSQESDAASNLKVEVFCGRSFSDEFQRGIVEDIPLVPLVFVVMSIFTCCVFAQGNKVLSQSLLGFGAVVSVLLSILTGNGIGFLLGIPFTSMTQILPFIVFGVGLDNSFIINGSFRRTDPRKDPVERVRDTVNDVGMSVSLTTMTSALAFGLGCMSSVPAVIWLCAYAVPTILSVYLYQMTFFLAITVIDERRVMDHRRDCFVCIKVNDFDEETDGDHSMDEHVADRFMGWFANLILQPRLKVAIVVAFTVLAGACAWSSTKLEQEFDIIDVVPSDSYVVDFFAAFRSYTFRSPVEPSVYFRDVDQSDPDVQAQMKKYVADLVEIDAISEPPQFFWLESFDQYRKNPALGLQNSTFNAQLDAFLNVPLFNLLYKNDIVRDVDGTVRESRCRVSFDNLDTKDVTAQIKAIKDQRAVTQAQPVNQGQDDWKFFTYNKIFNVWEFYVVSLRELATTTVMGVASVTAIALIFVPHWSAALFVFPLITLLYVDLLGFMQWCGSSINAVSYVGMVMSIGLLVDFIMHVFLRYMECRGTRDEKTNDTLKTMGASILVGAISTFLGTLPLAVSSSEIFKTIFFAFLGLVLFGASHGLILMPVVLSLIGPEGSISHDTDTEVESVPRSMTDDEEMARTVSPVPSPMRKTMTLTIESFVVRAKNSLMGDRLEL